MALHCNVELQRATRAGLMPYRNAGHRFIGPGSDAVLLNNSARTLTQTVRKQPKETK
jgi:uncharacterized protein (DUF2345 family)